MSVNIFIVYSREDEEHLEDLRQHLSVFERSQGAQVWYDGKVEAGAIWEVETQTALRNANIVLLLVSADFMASDDCYGKMQEVLALHDEGKIRAVPVILRACLWEDTPLASKTVLPNRSRPVINEDWASADEPYHLVMEALKPLVDHFRKGRKANEVVLSATPPALPPPVAKSFYQKFKWPIWGLGLVFGALVFLYILGSSEDTPEAPQNTITDPRDGKIYTTVKMGNKTWMAENLNFDTDGSWCYNDNPAACDKFGRLYNWEAAQIACPEGWHLSTEAEWHEMANLFDGAYDGRREQIGTESYKKLMLDSTIGFEALPGGFRDDLDEFKYVNMYAYFWTDREDNDALAYAYFFSPEGYLAWVTERKEKAYSCRCVKD